jgi:hypothetical protein
LYLEKVRNLIAENRIDDALQELAERATAAAAARNELLNLRRRWVEILRKEESNSEHGHILAVEKSKFTGDLLGFVDRLEISNKDQKSLPGKPSLPLGKIVAGGVSLLLLVILVVWGIQDGKEVADPPKNDLVTTDTDPQEDDSPKKEETSSEKSLYEDLISFDQGDSEYFMANTDDREIAVAVYFSEGLDFGEFNETFTRQVIKHANWGDRATPEGFKYKFHESSLPSRLYWAALDEEKDLPSYFPRNSPYDVIVIVQIGGDLALMPAEAGIAAWDAKRGKRIASVYRRNFPRMMGDDGTLDPGIEFIEELETVSALIFQR